MRGIGIHAYRANEGYANESPLRVSEEIHRNSELRDFEKHLSLCDPDMPKLGKPRIAPTRASVRSMGDFGALNRREILCRLPVFAYETDRSRDAMGGGEMGG